jgi:hypothetical protein
MKFVLSRRPARPIKSTNQGPKGLGKSAPLFAAVLGLAAVLPGCLQRPLGTDRPRTTNVLVDLLVQNVVDKVDMLFVVDNSMSMKDKQAILQAAVPDLMARFVNPVCVNPEGEEVDRPAGSTTCPGGSAPEFNAIKDINIGVITSSLGGFGSDSDCLRDGRGGTYDQTADMAHLMGSLPRGANTGGDFLQWRPNGDINVLTDNFTTQVGAAGEFGCGWEATMESWVRFLVDPYPYTEVVRAPCNASDTANSCGKPKTDATGAPEVDQVLLAQRQEFLRMDSLLAVIMLTDENDCSFKVGGQQWLLSDTVTADGRQSSTYRGSAQCAVDPNDKCCFTCGANPPSGCDSAGCEVPTYPEPSNLQGDFFEDQINLRCYKQKQRFGLDFLYPVERYSNALSLDTICPAAPDLNPEGCPGTVVDNPVFTRQEADGLKTRPKSLVFFAGILGVPWQDLAIDPTGGSDLRYKKAKDDNNPTIDWDILLGEKVAPDAPAGKLKRQLYPTLNSGIDPLMFESVDARMGTNPATRQALAGPDAAFMANSINGHEWKPLEGSDLQYACIFKLAEPTDCPTEQEARDKETAESARQPNCDCTLYGNTDDLEYNTPLCQSQAGYGMSQTYAKAYPGIRQLQALELFSEVNPTKNAIVASICPKEPDDMQKDDFGYRPAVATIVDRLKEQLQEPCLPRALSRKEDDSAACIIVEATKDASACQSQYRSALDPSISDAVVNALKSGKYCKGADCDTYSLCEIPQIPPSDEASYNACITGGSNANGWCYVDRDQFRDGAVPDAVETALEKCPATAQRKLRFAGEGKAETASSLTFFACSGSVYDAE